MKKILFLLFTALILSCAEKKKEMPAEVLPKDKFISVMVDMYLLESKFSHANLIDKPTYEKGVQEYETLFKKHGTNKKQVESSIDYYTHQPDQMREIQATILDSLNLRSVK